jgi:hypothetical protein
MDGREFVLAEVTTCVDRGRKTNGPIFLRDPQIGGVKTPVPSTTTLIGPGVESPPF